MSLFPGLIFDFDGLIADTESAIFQAWAELYEHHGHTLSLEDYVNCVGSTFAAFDPMAELEIRLGRAVEWEPVLARKDARIRELHEPLAEMPGVRALLEEARSAGVRCAVASSSQALWVEPWLEKLALRPFFEVVRTRDGGLPAKPAPDLFLAAARDLALAPADCLVLEDSRNGLKAAIAAGSPCVIVPSPVTRGSDFSGAAGIVESLHGVSLAGLCALGRGTAGADVTGL